MRICVVIKRDFRLLSTWLRNVTFRTWIDPRVYGSTRLEGGEMRGGEQILAAILRGPLPRPFLREKVLLLSELYIYNSQS